MAKEPAVNINLGDDSESLTQEEAFAKIGMILANTANPKLLTELDDLEIRNIAALWTVAEKTKNQMLLTFLTTFMQLRVSYKRKGRSELLELSKASRVEKEGAISRFKQMVGWR